MWKAVVVAVFLWGTTARGKAETLVVYAGGAAPTPAWQGGAIGKAIQFPETFPRMIKGEGIAGLAPGAEVLAFGACDKGTALAWVKMLKLLGVDSAQARPTKETALAGCPQLEAAKLKRLTVLQKPLPADGGTVIFLEAADLLAPTGKKQAMSVFQREGVLLDVWLPPRPKTEANCVAFIDRQLGLLQTDCAAHEGADNCFVTERIGYTVAAVGGALKAKPTKPRTLKRECAE